MKRYLLLAAALAGIGILVATLRSGPITLSAVTNVSGVPYPQEKEYTVITENLAHQDLYGVSTPFAKQLALTVTFVPLASEELSVGVRENSFWLSYPRYTLYQRDVPTTINSGKTPITRTVNIPLTDKLPDRDGSLDVMFFAGSETEPKTDPTSDTTLWYLQNVTAETTLAYPSLAAMKDYVHSKVTRETPL